MTKDEALKLALKALELVNIEFVCNGAHHAKKDRHEVGDERPVTDRYRQAIIAIEEALAQPTSGDYALGYSIGFGEGHSAGKALAQPEQEPVAWLQICLAPLHEGDVIARTTKPTKWNPEWWRFEPLYTTPPQRKPLTDEDVERIVYQAKVGEHGIGYTIARATEAAHGIKGD